MRHLILFAASILIIESSALAAVVQAGDLWDDLRLSLACICSATIWGVLGIGIFPPGNDSDRNIIRRVSFKLAASSAGGMTFAPMVIQHFGLPLTIGTVAAVTAVTALSTVGVLHRLIPRIEKHFDGA